MKQDQQKFQIPQEWRISKRFYGNRIYFEETHNKIEQNKQQLRQILSELFEDKIQIPQELTKDLLTLYLDYMEQIYLFGQSLSFNFEKTSCLMEISHYIYCQSFSNFHNIDQSFNLFKSVLVRHSLFKPPDSIQVFDLEDIKEISDFFIHTFYRNYDLYFFSNTPSINFEVRTFDIFKSRFPYTDTLAEAQPILRTEIPLLQEYLVDKETGLTPEQLEEIMKGDSIHQVPAKKREEWMRLKKERERQARIDKVIKREVERLNAIFEEKVKAQDEAFLESVNALKNPKKK